MHYKELFGVLTRAFDSENCLRFIEGIYQNDRWFNTPAFNRTAEFCYKAMLDAGLAQVEKLPLTADGKTAYGDWALPRAWDAKSATLTLRRDGKPDIKLADYVETPCSLVMNSSATPKGGVTATVVIADSPEDLEPATPDIPRIENVDGTTVAGVNQHLTGKIILTKLKPQEIVKQAAQNGVLGIVSSCMPLYDGVRNSVRDVYDTHHWENDYQTLNDYGLFAFTLSPRNDGLLRAALAETPEAVLFAEADTRRYDGLLHVVSGLLEGADGEAGEVLIYGHLYEPGAHDNASGCALILELARALSEAVSGGIIDRPRRGIRFVMGPECAGSTGYIAAHPERARNTLCALVTDMVGSEAKCNAQMHVWHNPKANWSFTDALIHDIFYAHKQYSGNRYKTVNKPFTIGTDNILSDPCFNVPTAAMITHPALSYHSSMDTPDLIETDVLHRNGVVAGTYLCYAADAGEKEAVELNGLLSDNLQYDLFRAGDEPDVSQLHFKMHNAYSRAFSSLERLLIPDRTRREAAPGWSRIPVRKVIGPLTFDLLKDRGALPYKPAWSTSLNDPLFWADGKRNLWQVARLAALNSDETDMENQYAFIAGYFEFLAERGYIEWR
jgi:hypothetical protein